MFLRNKYKNHHTNIYNHPKMHYSELMKIVDIWLDNLTDNNEKVYLLDYIIKSIIEDICTSMIIKPLITRYCSPIKPPFPMTLNINNKKISVITDIIEEIDIADSHIYVCPWDNARTRNNLLFLKSKQFEYQSDNHFVYYFKELNLCYVYNGNHSINAGRYLKKGKIKVVLCELKYLYPYIYTNGSQWFSTNTNEIIDDVCDFRFAVIFSIQKIKKYYEQITRSDENQNINKS